jgi:hypothetical protein
METDMREPAPRKRFGRFEYDATTANWLIAAMVLAAAVLGVVAFSDKGSPRVADKATLQSGATIPNPSELSPAQTIGAPALKK